MQNLQITKQIINNKEVNSIDAAELRKFLDKVIKKDVLHKCIEKLSTTKNFNEVFLFFEDYRYKLCTNGLYFIYKNIEGFCKNESEFKLFLGLKEYIFLEYIYAFSVDKKENKEYNIETKIIKNFDKIFDNIIFNARQHILPNNKRIDILGTERKTGRDVIIEIKKGNKNPAKQLKEYAEFFYNARLIAITEEEVLIKDNDVEYLILNNFDI